MNKYLKKVMINFKQFLEEAKKKKIKKMEEKITKIQAKPRSPENPLSKHEVMAVLNSQGGIGAKAVERVHGKQEP